MFYSDICIYFQLMGKIAYERFACAAQRSSVEVNASDAEYLYPIDVVKTTLDSGRFLLALA